MDGEPPSQSTVLPDDLVGEHVDPRTVLPAWWPRFGPPACSVLVIGGVIWQASNSSWMAALALGLLGGVGVVLAFRSAGRTPTSTALDDRGVTVSILGGPPRRAAWGEVRGVRVFTRPVDPRLLLADHGSLTLPGLTTAQGKQLAGWLAGVGHHEVVLEVDGREHRL